MMYLYLDESGDLGFDFEKKSPSRYFTICILAITERDSFRKIGKAVKKTLTNKLKKRKKKSSYELKGSRISLDAKRYFYEKIKDCKFEIYGLTMDKMLVDKESSNQKDRLYNFIVGDLISRIPLEGTSGGLQVAVDKCKDRIRREKFDEYIGGRLKNIVGPQVPINVDHLSSQYAPVIQAVDLFSWGIYRKYEKNDTTWYDYFRDRITYDGVYTI